MKSIHERARAYLAKMPHSVSGEGGHTAAFEAALALTKGFALSPEDSYALLVEWNSRCVPPWNERELRHKLEEAASSLGQAFGYLLGDHAGSSCHRRVPDVDNTANERSGQRSQWPTFTPLKPAGIRIIAKLREIHPDAVDLACRRGLLGGAWVNGHRCFVVHEGTFAQARRFDGEPLATGEGKPIKAKNLPSSEGAFIGSSHLGKARNVLLVEGAIGLLEAYAAILLVNSPLDWAAVAATSATSRFARDPELLKRLAGRHVRIVADPDEAGMKAASMWLADLENVGCTVKAFTAPEGCKDLGELLRDPGRYMEHLNNLFL
jgi:hypothetical protein